MMDDRGKSDRFVVPTKSPNKAPQRAAEVMEGRGRTKGNTPERNAFRTQRRADAPSVLACTTTGHAGHLRFDRFRVMTQGRSRMR